MNEISAKGVELYRMPEKEQQRWFEKFQGVTEKWVKDLEAKGLPAKKTVLYYHEESEKCGITCPAVPVAWR
jgi:hypothetical protein